MRRIYPELTGTTFWTTEVVGNPRMVAIGPYRIERADIMGCSLATVTERDISGRVWTLTLFVAWAVVMLIGVVDFGWRTRFLLGAGVLGAIATMAAFEALQLKPITHWRLDIALKGGRKVAYATASREDADALADEIAMIARRNAVGTSRFETQAGGFAHAA